LGSQDEKSAVNHQDGGSGSIRSFEYPPVDPFHLA
jgi:hypothetical protein